MYTCTCNGDTDTQHVCMNVLHAHIHAHTHTRMWYNNWYFTNNMNINDATMCLSQQTAKYGNNEYIILNASKER